MTLEANISSLATVIGNDVKDLKSKSTTCLQVAAVATNATTPVPGPNVVALWSTLTNQVLRWDGSAWRTTIIESAVEKALSVDAVGKVGIGIYPSYQLHISVPTLNNTVSAAFQASDGVWNTYLHILHSSSGITLHNSNSYSGSGNNLMFSTSIGETARIRYDGNFGVGTTSPTYKFVVSNASAQGFEIDPVTGAGGGVSTFSYNRATASYIPQTGYASSFAWYSGSNNRGMMLDGDGNLAMNAGTLGYGSGAFGTATQSLGKSQAVVMATPKPSGRITMHNASLAAGAVIEFGFTNTLLSASDGIVVRPDGFTGYSVEPAYFNSAIEVVLRVTNKGATRTDPVNIIFQIIKGS